MHPTLPILITGADELPGRLLVEFFRQAGFTQLLCLGHSYSPRLLAQFCAAAGCVLHPADNHCAADPTDLTNALLQRFAARQVPDSLADRVEQKLYRTYRSRLTGTIA